MFSTFCISLYFLIQSYFLFFFFFCSYMIYYPIVLHLMQYLSQWSSLLHVYVTIIKFDDVQLYIQLESYKLFTCYWRISIELYSLYIRLWMSLLHYVYCICIIGMQIKTIFEKLVTLNQTQNVAASSLQSDRHTLMSGVLVDNCLSYLQKSLRKSYMGETVFYVNCFTLSG